MFGIGFVALVTSVALAGPLPEEPWPAAQLVTPIDFPGFDDQLSTFQEVVGHLSARFNLTIKVNERAFRDERCNEVAMFKIAGKQPVAPMAGVPFARAIEAVLERLPNRSGAIVLARADHLEITTVAAARAEILGEDKRPLLPLIHLRETEQPIEKVLVAVMAQTPYSIVVDARAKTLLNKPVTIRLMNVPTDRALQTIAELGGLQVVRRQNIFVVTTPEQAERLRKEESAPVKSTGK